MKLRLGLLMLAPMLAFSTDVQAAPKVDTSRCGWLDHWTGTSQFVHGKAAIRDGKTMMHLGEVYALGGDELAHLSTTCGQPALAKVFSTTRFGMHPGKKFAAGVTLLSAAAVVGGTYCQLNPTSCGLPAKVCPSTAYDDCEDPDDLEPPQTGLYVAAAGGFVGLYGTLGWAGAWDKKGARPWTVYADNAAKSLHKAVVDFQVAAKKEREVAQTSWNACQAKGSDELSYKAQADGCGTYVRLIANGSQTRKIGTPASMQVSGLVPWLKDLAVNHDAAKETEAKAFARYMEAAFDNGRSQCRQYPSDPQEAAVARDACERGIKVLQAWGSRSESGAWASVAPDAFKAGEAFVAKAEDRTGSMMTDWKRLKEAARPKPKPKSRSSSSSSSYKRKRSTTTCKTSMVNGRYCCPDSYSLGKFQSAQRRFITMTRRSPNRLQFQVLLNEFGCWKG